MSLKIMVVDDEPLSLKVMRTLAVPLGHTVVTLDNSQMANAQAEKQRFDVVFVGMPRLDGFELAQLIQGTHPASETTIVMLSASQDIQMLRKAFGSGASFVLPKPIAAGRVIPMLNAMELPGWREKRHMARLPLFTEVNCTWDDQSLPMQSMNISETGMLLRSPHNLKMAQEVSLKFSIAEVHAALNIPARIVRLEGADRVGMEFISLAPEDQNAIQLYVMGHLKKDPSPRVSSDFKTRRLFHP
jgi:CheY-like chemotaxis protein